MHPGTSFRGAQPAARATVITIAASLVWPVMAKADTGIPTLAVMWPLFWVVFPLVVAVEASAGRRLLLLKWRRAFRLSTVANLASAIVGVPAAWFFAFLCLLAVGTIAQLLPEKVALVIVAPFYAAWLPPIEPEHSRLLPGALLVLCLPSYVVSVWIERRVARRLEPNILPEQLNMWARTANRLSYGAVSAALVAIVICFYFIQ